MKHLKNYGVQDILDGCWIVTSDRQAGVAQLLDDAESLYKAKASLLTKRDELQGENEQLRDELARLKDSLETRHSELLEMRRQLDDVAAAGAKRTDSFQKLYAAAEKDAKKLDEFGDAITRAPIAHASAAAAKDAKKLATQLATIEFKSRGREEEYNNLHKELVAARKDAAEYKTKWVLHNKANQTTLTALDEVAEVIRQKRAGVAGELRSSPVPISA